MEALIEKSIDKLDELDIDWYRTESIETLESGETEDEISQEFKRRLKSEELFDTSEIDSYGHEAEKKGTTEYQTMTEKLYIFGNNVIDLEYELNGFPDFITPGNDNTGRLYLKMPKKTVFKFSYGSRNYYRMLDLDDLIKKTENKEGVELSEVEMVLLPLDKKYPMLPLNMLKRWLMPLMSILPKNWISYPIFDLDRFLRSETVNSGGGAFNNFDVARSLLEDSPYREKSENIRPIFLCKNDSIANGLNGGQPVSNYHYGFDYPELHNVNIRNGGKFNLTSKPEGRKFSKAMGRLRLRDLEEKDLVQPDENSIVVFNSTYPEEYHDRIVPYLKRCRRFILSLTGSMISNIKKDKIDELIKRCHVYISNDEEFGQLFGNQDFKNQFEDLYNDTCNFDCGQLYVTLTNFQESYGGNKEIHITGGKKGGLLLTDDKKLYYKKARDEKPKTTLRAGDTYGAVVMISQILPSDQSNPELVLDRAVEVSQLCVYDEGISWRSMEANRTSGNRTPMYEYKGRRMVQI